MLSRPLSYLVVGLSVSALFGCQQNRSVVENLPQPNFNGPSVLQRPVVAQQLPPVQLPAPAVKQAAPAPALAMGTPRDWVPRAPARPWKYIVIHHSASPSGSVAVFDREHKAKGWDECGYHFVIGNGTDSGNGQVEAGPRWPKQKYGAHAKTPDNRYNDFGIGICLVGNFDVDRPTAAQVASLNKLVAYLMKTYHVPASGVIGHRDTKATDCPGRNFNVALVRRDVRQLLADSGEKVDADEPAQTASMELLVDQAAQ